MAALFVFVHAGYEPAALAALAKTMAGVCPEAAHDL